MKKAIQAANRLALECDTHDPFEMCKGLGIAVHRRKLIDVRGYYLNPLGVPQISLANDLGEPTKPAWEAGKNVASS